MKKNIRSLLLVTGFTTLFAGSAMAPVGAATDPFGNNACSNVPDSTICEARDDPDSFITTDIKNVVNLLLFVVGILAVIVIIVGGIMYTTSGGDPSKVKSAKDTILYAVIGLVVAILAYSIVNFVVDAFIPGAPTGGGGTSPPATP